jgi:NAD(P)H-dependent FMN reductase
MKIQLIIGSTRPGRIGEQIAQWILSNLPQVEEFEYELVDLKEVNLPMFDEAVHPMMQQYSHEHTKIWSERIKPASGFIFLTPEYNAGYPASLKNAIDYLYHEWVGKSVMVVSYGAGGGLSAGAQLRQVAERLKMRITDDSPAISVPNDIKDQNGQIKEIDSSFKPYLEAVIAGAHELIELINTDPEL